MKKYKEPTHFYCSVIFLADDGGKQNVSLRYDLGIAEERPYTKKQIIEAFEKKGYDMFGVVEIQQNELTESVKKLYLK